MQASYPGRLYDFSPENVATVAASLRRKIAELAGQGQEAEDVVWSSSPVS